MNSLPLIGLVDSGASCSILSGRTFERLKKTSNRLQLKQSKRHTRLLSADASPMLVSADVDVDLKIGGLSLPFTFCVIDKLDFDIILGMDFLRESRAVIDIRSNSLIIFDSVTSVPMTHTSEDKIVQNVSTVTIPPFSEAIIKTSTCAKNLKGSYIIEQSPYAKCNALLIARAVVDTKQKTFPCRMLNPTDRPITLKPRTPVGALVPVTIENAVTMKAPPQENPTLSVNEKRLALEKMGITFEGTALVGEDLNKLICTLYRNRDVMATSIKDLPGCDILMHRIETGDAPPIRKRTYRYSPADKAEISRQTREMLEAGIIEPSDTPWKSSILLVAKKAQLKIAQTNGV